MSGMGFRETRLLINGLYAHLLHKGADMDSAYLTTLPFEDAFYSS